jgi:hypothetical protein
MIGLLDIYCNLSTLYGVNWLCLCGGLRLQFLVRREGSISQERKTYLTQWSRALLEKLTGLQLVKKFPAFLEPEGSLPQP